MPTPTIKIETLVFWNQHEINVPSQVFFRFLRVSFDVNRIWCASLTESNGNVLTFSIWCVHHYQLSRIAYNFSVSVTIALYSGCSFLLNELGNTCALNWILIMMNCQQVLEFIEYLTEFGIKTNDFCKTYWIAGAEIINECLSVQSVRTNHNFCLIFILSNSTIMLMSCKNHSPSHRKTSTNLKLQWWRVLVYNLHQYQNIRR